MKRIPLNYKNTLVAFRFISFMLMLFLIIYAPENQIQVSGIPIFPLAVYFLSNLALFFVESKRLQSAPFQFGLFLFDVAVVSWLMYAGQGWSSDLYLIYFLVIFMSGIEMRIWHSFIIGTVACVMYSYFVLRFSPNIEMSTHILLRFPFFYIISFYTAYLSKHSQEMKDRLELSYHEKIDQAEERIRLGRLAVRIAEGMTNPLSVSLGFAQGMLKRITDSHEFYLPVSSIYRETGRCVWMIDDMMMLSEETLGREELVDINALIESMLSELSLPSKTIQVTFRADPSASLIKGDRKQLFRAIKNVVENAVEAMPSGGELTVTTKQIGPNSGLEIEISDNGTGIAAKDKRRIFEPFFSTKESGGAGLGLAVASAIFQRHHGRISFESAEGQGTTFFIVLSV